VTDEFLARRNPKALPLHSKPFTSCEKRFSLGQRNARSDRDFVGCCERERRVVFCSWLVNMVESGGMTMLRYRVASLEEWKKASQMGVKVVARHH
jgi:hypothetical protein